MIFVTVGTSTQPFDRLVEAVEPLCELEEVVVQHGASAVRPRGATCVAFLDYKTLLDHMADARIVITHAGVGSVMTALSVGKRPLVVPRVKSLGEAVDDHQLELARKLDEAGIVELVSDPGTLPHAVARAQETHRSRHGGTNALAEDIRRYVLARVAS